MAYAILHRFKDGTAEHYQDPGGASSRFQRGHGRLTGAVA
jgi:hypothetical protein